MENEFDSAHALTQARKKLSDLLGEKARIDKEIVNWKRVVDSLSAVSEERADDPVEVEISTMATPSRKATIKFTDAVRMVMRQSAFDRPIGAPFIKEQLENLGFDFSRYAQPLVPIHNCLKRLCDQGEVFLMKNSEGQTTGYKWVSPLERALISDPSDSDDPAEIMRGAFARPKSRNSVDAVPPHLKNLGKK